MSCYYCELYTMKGNSGKAQAYLDQATAYLDSSFGDRVEAQYLRTKSFYYWKEKDYRHALSAVNLALKINRDLDKLEMKKAILQSSGQLQEAVTIYEEIINKTETINMDAFEIGARSFEAEADCRIYRSSIGLDGPTLYVVAYLYAY